MLQLLLFGCIVFPLLAALAVVFAKDETLRRRIVFTGTGITALSAIGLALYGSFTLPVAEGSSLNPLLTLLDFALLLYILYLALKLKHKLSTGLAIGQIGGMLYLDFFLLEGSHPAAFTGDPLALLMVLVISLIGGVICIFGLGYMHEHEDHLRLPSTRQPRFFFFLLLFLGAMNGLVLCDSLPWVFFFWEVTTLCSFMLI
ncbi:MAG: NADH-quinone oxidoreductase subunit L, partial [Bilophila sp.]